MRNTKQLLEKKVFENPNPKPERESISLLCWWIFERSFVSTMNRKTGSEQKAQGPTNNGYCLQE